MSEPQLRVQRHSSLRFGGRLIEVIVGTTDPVSFHVQEGLICELSDYFRRIMKKEWPESKSRQVRLEEQEASTFDIYLNWLYCRTIPTRASSVDEEGNTEYLQLAKAYTLGDYIQDYTFKNAVIDAFVEKQKTATSDGYQWFPYAFVVRHIYEHTPEHSKLRKLLVHQYVQYGEIEWLTEWSTAEDLPWQFLFDLSAGLLGSRSGPNPASTDPKDFHELHPSNGLDDQVAGTESREKMT